MGIEDIRRKKMQEINNNELQAIEKQLAEQQAVAEQMQQQLALIESVAKQFMNREAISRYGALKIAHPETAVKAIAFIAQAAQLGHIKEKLSDEDFKTILNEIKEGKASFKFRK
jgi:DNA-binding TFAR19-related protein (PDSD5 family)